MTKNQATHNSPAWLKNTLTKETDVIQEYFVPADNFVGWLDQAHLIIKDSGANLINAAVRVVHADETLLRYARQDMFSVVLFFNHRVDGPSRETMQIVTRQLIDSAVQHGGTFYLPYQLLYTREQLTAAYPQVEEFFRLKRQLDHDQVFTNTWYDTFGK